MSSKSVLPGLEGTEAEPGCEQGEAGGRQQAGVDAALERTAIGAVDELGERR